MTRKTDDTSRKLFKELNSGKLYHSIRHFYFLLDFAEKSKINTHQSVEYHNAGTNYPPRNKKPLQSEGVLIFSEVSSGFEPL